MNVGGVFCVFCCSGWFDLVIFGVVVCVLCCCCCCCVVLCVGWCFVW